MPPSGSIEKRAEELARGISDAANGREVNIIAHSMGGLDARYMISHLHPANVKVRSLVTVASPHHGSSFADFLFQELGNERLPEVYKFLERVGMETGAFEQLTSTYMNEKFNPNTPDDPDVKYFSYGACKWCTIILFSSFPIRIKDILLITISICRILFSLAVSNSLLHRG